MPLKVAIVGSGPSGFYTVAALLKSGVDCQIDIIERLPTPFGLIRGGVAPDHQKTKNVWRAYEKSALNEAVRYYGNVEVGRDITVGELQDIYDAVVLAVGSPLDRKLGIPGEDKQGVIGSASFVGWYNGHPDFRDLDPDLNISAAVVVGNGNVAVDCARVLAKTPEEMTATDLTDYAAAAIHASPLTDIYMCGRRGPVEAKFTNVELREMGQLTDCHPVVDPAQLPDSVPEGMEDRERRLCERNLESLRGFTTLSAEGKTKRLHFSFFANPVEILGGDRVEAVKLEHTAVENGRAVGTGKFFEVACGLVIPAIGYYGEPFPGVPFDERGGIVVHDDGLIQGNVYAVGWIKRGPTGVIGTNKHDGDHAAARILDEQGNGDKSGRLSLETLLGERDVRWVTYPDWKKIDESEIANANPGAPRRKYSRIEEMLAVLD
ncbi:MAG: FAD-dependent oxidoreductase [Alphaproteobacteria bacterium]|nr:FAD-dependent oxidoreductase [Alphaproteobacteria bacterium]